MEALLLWKKQNAFCFAEKDMRCCFPMAMEAGEQKTEEEGIPVCGSRVSGPMVYGENTDGEEKRQNFSAREICLRRKGSELSRVSLEFAQHLTVLCYMLALLLSFHEQGEGFRV
jgi:hypothetical protein